MTEEKIKSFEERVELLAENHRLRAKLGRLKKKAGSPVTTGGLKFQTHDVQVAPLPTRKPPPILTTTKPGSSRLLQSRDLPELEEARKKHATELKAKILGDVKRKRKEGA